MNLIERMHNKLDKCVINDNNDIDHNDIDHNDNNDTIIVINNNDSGQ